MDFKKSILIIDDDVSFSGATKMILEQKGGYEVGVCNRSAKALTLIREMKPDLVLLDVVMPGLDGGEVAAKIREDRELRNVPVIFLTSLMTEEEAAAHPMIGKYKFISKPIQAEDLLKRVKDFFTFGH